MLALSGVRWKQSSIMLLTGTLDCILIETWLKDLDSACIAGCVGIKTLFITRLF